MRRIFPIRRNDLQFNQRSLGRCLCFAALLLGISQAEAVPPSDTLLPKTTKGFLSVLKPAEFDERWQKTQFGQLYNDDLMQPFVEQLRKQFREKYDEIEKKLGVTYDDLTGV